MNFVHLYHHKKQSIDKAVAEFGKVLLESDDWFSLWRLNCTVVALHSFVYNSPKGYKMENKWEFLERGRELGIPISPYLDSVKDLVIKHRNEEGGMGIYFYKNATIGGDWIIQERIENSSFVNSLLPKNAPLSTFRVITQSKASINLGDDYSENNIDDAVDQVTALSCTFRAGRMNAATDHNSILFDVNMKTGDILKGSSNQNWYVEP